PRETPKAGWTAAAQPIARVGLGYPTTGEATLSRSPRRPLIVSSNVPVQSVVRRPPTGVHRRPVQLWRTYGRRPLPRRTCPHRTTRPPTRETCARGNPNARYDGLTEPPAVKKPLCQPPTSGSSRTRKLIRIETPGVDQARSPASPTYRACSV